MRWPSRNERLIGHSRLATDRAPPTPRWFLRVCVLLSSVGSNGIAHGWSVRCACGLTAASVRRGCAACDMDNVDVDMDTGHTWDMDMDIDMDMDMDLDSEIWRHRQESLR